MPFKWLLITMKAVYDISETKIRLKLTLCCLLLVLLLDASRLRWFVKTASAATETLIYVVGVKMQSEWQTFQVIQFLNCILGICLKISTNKGQMRYCCSISIKIRGYQYPEFFSVRRSTPECSFGGWTAWSPCENNKKQRSREILKGKERKICVKDSNEKTECWMTRGRDIIQKCPGFSKM